MGGHQPAQAVGVPGGEQLDHLAVFGHRALPLRFVKVGPEAKRLQPGVDVGPGLRQHPVACRCVDLAVDQGIEPVVGGQVAPGEGRQHLVVQRLQLGQRGGRDAKRRQFTGLALQRGDQLEGVGNVLRRHHRHHRTSVRQQLDQALGGQHLDRLAQRRARDLQGFTQLALVELVARRQLALDDALAQPQGHRLVQHWAGQGKDVGHRFAWGLAVVCVQN